MEKVSRLQNLKEESEWNRHRIAWTLLSNIHRDAKKRPHPFEPADFITLSFDKPKEIKIITDDEFKEIKKKFGSIL